MVDGSDAAESTQALCATDEVSPDDPVVVTVDGESIAVFEDDGNYYALNDVCPHQGGPLGDGKVDDGCVYCPWHGWQFDLETGKHVQGIEDATAYDVIEQEGELFLAD